MLFLNKVREVTICVKYTTKMNIIY